MLGMTWPYTEGSRDNLVTSGRAHAGKGLHRGPMLGRGVWAPPTHPGVQKQVWGFGPCLCPPLPECPTNEGRTESSEK